MLSHHASDPLQPLSVSNPEITSINTTIAQIDADILDLQRKRFSWLRRLNDLQASTRVLPLEVLSIIFEAVAQSASPSRTPSGTLGPKALQALRLGAVCSQWRSVARSTPSLWTDIIVPTSITPSYVHLFNLQYNNASGHPVAIHFKNLDNSNPLSKEIASIIFQKHTERLGSLTMSQNEHVSWPSLISDFEATSFPRLRSLHLTYHRRKQPRSDVAVPHCPELRELHLEGETDWLAFPFPWSQITTLKLSSMTASHTLKLILQCPHLHELHCTSIHNDLVNVPPPQEVIEMTNLENIDWDGAMPNTLLTHVGCPALRQLTWGVRPSPPRDSSRQFLSHMKHLSTFNIRYDSSDITEMLDAMPSIRTIRLLSYTNSKYVTDLLRHLTITKTISHAPLLETISVTDCEILDEQSMMEAVTQMLISRWRLRGRPSIGMGRSLRSFSLDYGSVGEQMNWSWLEKTVHRGYGEIRIASQEVKAPWLEPVKDGQGVTDVHTGKSFSLN
ncbi:hypothetical protein P691DRAFT_568665 [Macrolepiota fuliginosa MF-IS2]|uniref:F-box domain-containing protein n=1 Tax=Macrolepiota fuliginosa MF-IS2 TaxID=1400762 RepID=A0A9P5XE72_9AGAR|nr:hypothetical protein P691DRAFT_568665 [Macrolepiota fuliginosa MF-IS2]